MRGVRTAKWWTDQWKSFFEDRHASLIQVLDAGGCREGWLQAEAYRRFRNELPEKEAFYCNVAPLDGRGRADFAAYTSERDDARLTFVGECKVLGVDYQSKTVTGRAKDITAILKEFPLSTSIVLGNDNRTRRYWNEGTFSLLSDYFRLVGAPHITKNTLRMLFLVLDCRRPSLEMGVLLKRIQFERRCVFEVEKDNVVVRAWNIRGIGADG